MGGRIGQPPAMLLSWPTKPSTRAFVRELKKYTQQQKSRNNNIGGAELTGSTRVEIQYE
jgi:hypothetical protein